MAKEKAAGMELVYVIVIIGLVALILISVTTEGFGLGKGAQGAGGEQQPQQTATAAQITALMDDDMKIGSDSAPIVIVEFSDFQCPFCRKWFIESYPTLKREYIDTGKVQLVFRDFPLSFHPSAMKAAEAVECADDQKKGWEMHDKMYNEQAKLGAGTVQFSVDDMKKWASEIGVGSAAFDECLDGGKSRLEVQEDFSDGSNAGIKGTPSFILTKRDGSSVVPINGAQPYTAFKSAIEEMLQ